MSHATTFIEAMKNTAENLPGVLDDWKTIEPALADHYVEELARLVIEAALVEKLLNDIRAHSERIHELTGFDMKLVLVPPRDEPV